MRESITCIIELAASAAQALDRLDRLVMGARIFDPRSRRRYVSAKLATGHLSVERQRVQFAGE